MDTCVLTVASLMTSAEAISELLSPAASIRRTASSRSVSSASCAGRRSTAAGNRRATWSSSCRVTAGERNASPALERAIDGRGETVVLPELAETQLLPPVVSDLRQDMSRFDHLFGLPAVHLKVVTRIAGSTSRWLANGEEVLDAENVHAVAPDAAITVVLVKPTSLNSPANAIAAAVAALRVGASQGSVISISAAGQTGGEHCDTPTEVERLTTALQAAAARHVTVIAASGDIGAAGEPCAVIRGLTGGAFTPVKEVNLPAAEPLVLATGGTTLESQPRHGQLHRRDRVGSSLRQPRDTLPGLRRGTAAASGGLATRTACQASSPPGACPTYPPTRLRIRAWP